MLENEITDIKGKNRKIFDVLLPALSVGIIMILFNLLVAVSGFALAMFGTSLPIDSTIQDFLALFITQLISVITVIFVFIPFFKVKHTEFYPFNIASLRTTLILFFLVMGTTFISSLIFTGLFTVLKLEPQTGYSEIILNEEHISNPLNILLFLIPFTIGAAIFEEMAYRRLLIPLLEKNQVDSSTTVIISSIMFAMAHLEDDIVYGNIAGAIMHIVGLFLFALVLGITYILTRNVVFPIIIHSTANFFGSLSILLMLIGNENLLTIYSILMLVILVIGLGMTVYLVWKYSYGLRTKFIFNICNNLKSNGLIGFIAMGLVLVYTPMVVEICLALLKIDSEISGMLFIVCLTIILVMLVMLARESKHSLKEETVNNSSQIQEKGVS